MDLAGLSLLISALAGTGVLTAIPLAIRRVWRASVERATAETQAKAAVLAKNDEIAELNQDKAELTQAIAEARQQNAELWRLLEGLTK
jgi:septal ring factor EnvC (AmiA/AmiB activator)